MGRINRFMYGLLAVLMLEAFAMSAWDATATPVGTQYSVAVMNLPGNGDAEPRV
jgi:hypothetical protein